MAHRTIHRELGVASRSASGSSVTNARVAEILEDKAHHTIDTDEFGIDVAREAVRMVRDAGASDDLIWWLPAVTVDDMIDRLSWVGDLNEPTTLDGRPIYKGTTGTLTDRGFLIDERAITEPPVAHPHVPLLVRHPNALAVVQL